MAEYEAARTRQQGGSFLREQGLYSSQMTGWRKLRDVGVLHGKKSRQTSGKPSKEQAEIARLRCQLEVRESRLRQTETALDVMGKLHDLLENLCKDTKDNPKLVV